MIRTCALVAVLIPSAPIDTARGGELVECEPRADDAKTKKHTLH
jgi:hypothetical protein